MNRTNFALTLAFGVLTGSAPVLAQISKSFDFKGLNTTTTYNGQVVIGQKKCKLKGVDKEFCPLAYGTQVGEVWVDQLQTAFYNGKLYGIKGSTSIVGFSRLDASFRAKYGQPTKAETEKWQNQAGAEFNNQVETWNFDDGILELRERGDQRDTTVFIFAAPDNAPPKVAPTVNF